MRYLLLLLLFLPFSAHAEMQTEAVCDALTKYKKINNQKAAYQPGVDVNGNPVTPADLNAPPPVFQNVTKVPLTVDLVQKLSSLNGRGIEMKANFGLLSIHPDGRVTFGEEDMTADVKTVCGIPHEKKEEVVVKTEQAFPPQEPPIEPIDPAKPKVITKIVTDQPNLIPENSADIIQGGDYRN